MSDFFPMRMQHILSTILAILLLFSLNGEGYAEDLLPPTIEKIEIQGATRINEASVRQSIYSQIDTPLDPIRLSEDIKRLFATGFFSDIKVLQNPGQADGQIVLTFSLTERPVLGRIDYDLSGKAVDLDDIKKAVKLREKDLFNEKSIKEQLENIKGLYTKEGYFLAEASYRIQPISPREVGVKFIIKEGQKVEVRKLTLTGNTEVPSSEIKAILKTREGGWLSFLTKSGEFNQKDFDEDIQRLQYLYLTKGYVQVEVGEPSISLASDKKSMEILIPIKEGPRFKTGALELVMEDGDWDVPKEELEAKLMLKTGEWFDYAVMQEDNSYIANQFRDRGYANAYVSLDHHVDPENLSFGVTFRIQKGQPVFVRRIEIRGNKDTRDKVIRREMKIHEGELYSGNKVRLSERRITALGFFAPPAPSLPKGGVDIAMKPTGEPDTVDLVVSVKEKQTGTFQVGAGFSSFESFLFTAQISKENIFGRGQTLSAQATLSGIRQMGQVSFFEPYFFDSDFTFAFDLFNYNEIFRDFSRLRRGGSLSFGYRFTDDLSLSLSYTLESMNAELSRTDISIEKLRQEGLTSSVRATLAYDTRNNRLFPTDGQYTTLSLEYAGRYLGSENEFIRTIARTRWYFPLFWDMVLRLNATGGYIHSLDNRPVPLFERFFVGGIFTVRGFERNSIGERLRLASRPDSALSPITIGGISELILNAEIEFPIFQEMGLRGVVFLDAGNAWGESTAFDPLDLRTAAGFGIRWNSPVGPLRFEWGFPFKPLKGEDKSVFEFTIGNSF